MNLVRLLNLRFLNELAATNDRNLKFAALGFDPIRLNWTKSVAFYDLFRKPVPTPDQVRGRLFRDHALATVSAVLGYEIRPSIRTRQCALDLQHCGAHVDNCIREQGVSTADCFN